MKKMVIILIVILIIPPLFLFILDSNNIISILQLPISQEYDWLSFIGGYFSFVGTLILGFIAYYQNNRLSKINRELQKATLLSDSYSKICFLDIQTILENNKNEFYLILWICDKYQKPLSKVSFDKIDISFDNEKSISFTPEQKNISLEKTEHKEDHPVTKILKQYKIEDAYLVYIKLSDELNKTFKDFKSKKELKLILYGTYSNSLHVIVKQKNTITLSISKDIEPYYVGDCSWTNIQKEFNVVEDVKLDIDEETH